MKPQDFHQQLIRRYFDGTSTDEELEVLLRLVEQGVIDRELDRQADEWYRQEVLGATPTPVIVEPATRKIRYGWAYVAAAVVLFGIGVYLYQYQTPSGDPHSLGSSEDWARHTDIRPGGNRAILTLADGRLVELSDDQAGIVIGDGITYLDGSDIWDEDGRMTDGQIKERGLTDRSESLSYQLSTPKGGQYQVTLPDGTKVWLNAASSLRYPSQFDSEIRRVELTGEGYFEVAHDSDRSFVVASREQEVTVLGTHFNINAYEDESGVRTTLLQGAVEVQAAGQRDHDSKVVLRPGEQSLWTGRELTVHVVDPETVIDWKKGEFVFREDLQTAMRRVARWYNVEVVYEAGAPKDLMLGGWVSRQNDLAEVLAVMESTGKVKFRIEKPLPGAEERRVIVTK